MADSQPVRDAAVVDLEKGEDVEDTSSTLTGSSSAQDNKEHDTEPHSLSTAARENVEAYPNGAREPQSEDNEVARTSTRTSWRDVARAVTRISTKSSWKDPGPPPDGGLSGWTQVAVGHLIIMNTWSVAFVTA
jgi:hypothetical protein